MHEARTGHAEDFDAYVDYETLRNYCQNRDCEYCTNPCCALYDRKPDDFPELTLSENNLREISGRLLVE